MCVASNWVAFVGGDPRKCRVQEEARAKLNE